MKFSKWNNNNTFYVFIQCKYLLEILNRENTNMIYTTLLFLFYIILLKEKKNYNTVCKSTCILKIFILEDYCKLPVNKLVKLK